MREWCDRLPEEIPDGAKLMNDIYVFLGRFVAYPSEKRRSHTPYGSLTHILWMRGILRPRIAFLSPEPGSGKTRALEVRELLVPNPVEAVNVSPAYLFRKVADEAGAPTLLFDEIDTVFGPRAKDNEEIRGCSTQGIARAPSPVAVWCGAKRSSPKSSLPIARSQWRARASPGYNPHAVSDVRMRRRAPAKKLLSLSAGA